MLGKYTTTLWNALCILSILLSLKLILPFVQNQQGQQSKKEEVFPIKQFGAKRTLWKRGEISCTTTIDENKSISKVGEDSEHSTSDWMSITWEKTK